MTEKQAVIIEIKFDLAVRVKRKALKPETTGKSLCRVGKMAAMRERCKSLGSGCPAWVGMGCGKTGENKRLKLLGI